MVDKRCTRAARWRGFIVTLAAAVPTVFMTLAPAHAQQSRDCSAANGCMGYRQGMRVFAQNPRVQGLIGLNEHFIDLSTKTFNGQNCPTGVIRVGRNADRTFDPGATRDTTLRVGTDGGRPIESCAP